jgi:hypothetical protein
MRTLAVALIVLFGLMVFDAYQYNGRYWHAASTVGTQMKHHFLGR